MLSVHLVQVSDRRHHSERMTTTSEQQPTDTPLTDSCFHSSHADTLPSRVEVHVIFTMQILSFMVYNIKATCIADLHQRGLQSHLYYPRGNVIFNFPHFIFHLLLSFAMCSSEASCLHFSRTRGCRFIWCWWIFHKRFSMFHISSVHQPAKPESRLSIPRGLRTITERPGKWTDPSESLREFTLSCNS